MSDLKLVNFVLLLVLFTFSILGCEPYNEPDPKSDPGDVAPVVSEEVGGQGSTTAQVNCPVMGGKINKNIYTDYKGKRIYFCCSGCDETFKKDPEKYIKKLEDAGVVLEEVPQEKK